MANSRNQYLFVRFSSVPAGLLPLSTLSIKQCLATIASIYWKTNEESVEGERPLRTPISSPIESRSVPNSSSKADRVQGKLIDFFSELQNRRRK